MTIPKLYQGRNRTFFFFNWDRRGDFSAALTGRTLATDGLGRVIGGFGFINWQNANPLRNGQLVARFPW